MDFFDDHPFTSVLLDLLEYFFFWVLRQLRLVSFWALFTYACLLFILHFFGWIPLFLRDLFDRFILAHHRRDRPNSITGYLISARWNQTTTEIDHAIQRVHDFLYDDILRWLKKWWHVVLIAVLFTNIAIAAREKHDEIKNRMTLPVDMAPPPAWFLQVLEGVHPVHRSTPLPIARHTAPASKATLGSDSTAADRSGQQQQMSTPTVVGSKEFLDVSTCTSSSLMPTYHEFLARAKAGTVTAGAERGSSSRMKRDSAEYNSAHSGDLKSSPVTGISRSTSFAVPSYATRSAHFESDYSGFKIIDENRTRMGDDWFGWCPRCEQFHCCEHSW